LANRGTASTPAPSEAARESNARALRKILDRRRVCRGAHPPAPTGDVDGRSPATRAALPPVSPLLAVCANWRCCRSRCLDQAWRRIGAARQRPRGRPRQGRSQPGPAMLLCSRRSTRAGRSACCERPRPGGDLSRGLGASQRHRTRCRPSTNPRGAPMRRSEGRHTRVHPSSPLPAQIQSPAAPKLLTHDRRTSRARPRPNPGPMETSPSSAHSHKALWRRGARSKCR